MCNVQYYDPHIDFIGHYLKRDRHKYVEWGWKKNDMNLYLNIFSFIVDIRPGSEYPLMNEVNIFIIIIIIILREVRGLVIKYYKHPINLGFRMCSTGLLLWKNQEGSTCYAMILYKRDSTADIFLWIFKFFSDKLFQKTAPKPLIVKGFYLLRMPDDYCFDGASQGQLSQRDKYCNCFESSGKIS